MGSSQHRIAAASGLILVAVALAALISVSSYRANTSHVVKTKLPLPHRKRSRGRLHRQLRTHHEVANQTASSFHDNYDHSHNHRHRRKLFGSAMNNIQLERTTYKLPYLLEQNLIDWEDPPPRNGEEVKEMHTPIFWHILKSGGTTVKLLYSRCYRLVEAAENGLELELNPQLQMQQVQGQQQPFESQQQQPEPSLSDGSSQTNSGGGGLSPWEWMQQQAQPLLDTNNLRRRLEPLVGDAQQQQQIQQQSSTSGQQQQLRIVVAADGRKYVNVDVTTPEGILQASQLGFATANLADVILSPEIHAVSQSLVNSDTNRGRLFAMFRHPMQRAISIFYYLKQATWEPTYNPLYATMTIDEYVNSDFCESNWMVRTLVNKMTGPLEPGDVFVAQEILRRKCLVGLMEEFEESVVHFHGYFGFGDAEALSCARHNFARKGRNPNLQSHASLLKDTTTWARLEQKNALDLMLYEYAVKLFEEQGKWLKNEKMIP